MSLEEDSTITCVGLEALACVLCLFAAYTLCGHTGVLSMLDDLVAQASAPAHQASRASWSSVTHSLSRILPFPLKSQTQSQAAEVVRSVHAQARLLLALARVTQRQERSERFEAQRRSLVGCGRGQESGADVMK